MLQKEIKYSLCDMEIVPARISRIEHRSDIVVTDEDGYLPIFAAPMDSVCDDSNYILFEKQGIIPTIHRNVNPNIKKELLKKGVWVAVTMDEFDAWFCDVDSELMASHTNNTYRVIIDVANGHMQKIFDLVGNARLSSTIRGHKLILMSGNIANTLTYIDYCNAGIDYVRCSIGSGAMCITSSNSAVHYGNASLIDDIVTLKRDSMDCRFHTQFRTKIIVDGGIRNYSDVAVALALGADYVMIGGLFSAMYESIAPFDDSEYSDSDASNLQGKFVEKIVTNDNISYKFMIPLNCVGSFNELAEKYHFDKIKENVDSSESQMNRLLSAEIPDEHINKEDIARWLIENCSLYKTSHGMSTKEAQRGKLIAEGSDVDENKLKTSEGKVITQRVRYTLKQWTDNMCHYLRNTMSYCDARTLSEFIGKPTVNIKSYGTMMSVNK